jgi:nucleotide-binding universal stress UspA family protein
MDATVTPGSVVVGLEDSEGSTAALDWAARTAAAHGWPLTFVHAFPDLLQPPVHGFTGIDRELRAEAVQIAERAESRLRDRGWQGDPPARILQRGAPVTVLRRLAPAARMVVVGRRGRGGFLDQLVGSTAYGLAERCRVPVVIVPEAWDGEPAGDRPVVLGLDDRDDDEAIAFAFNLASLHGGRVRAVHACPAFNPYLAADLYGPAHEDWVRTQRALVAERVAAWREKFPDVTVEEEVRTGHPAGILIAESRSAGLLVIGGRARGGLLDWRLGSVSRAVMHHAESPLAVVNAAG